MFKKLTGVMFVLTLLTIGGYSQGNTDKTNGNNTPSGEKPKREPIFRPTKDQIKQVQTILNARKLYDREPSGKYDDETRKGIKVFQGNNGLKETGTLNRATLEKFGVELTESQKAIPVNPNSYASGSDPGSKSASATGSKTASNEDKPKRAAPFHATKDQIMAAQKLLKQQSMFSGDESGKFSDEFREGLKRFQASKGMKETGTLNAATLDKMGIPLTDNQKKNAND
jgi:peptidoglycan hydrolase-like protein with peptidoglycan-binding domain